MALLLAGVGWLPCVSPILEAVRPPADPLASGLTRALTAEGGALAAEYPRLPASRNPEWDLMANLYVVLALGNQALAKSSGSELQSAPAHHIARAARLESIDRIIEHTLQVEAEQGQQAFLLPYGRGAPFLDPQGRSLFVDGEVALMLATRLRVDGDPRWERLLRTRVAQIDGQLARGPALSGESYPNECWTFCNTTALAALVLADPVLGQDHTARVQTWIDFAKARLVDPDSGLLVSSFTWDGEPLEGPEGSSLWMVVHNLLLLDPEFADDQYTRAKAELGRTVLGVGWSAEWPSSHPARADVDSGPVVPLLEASPGASGLAILAAAAFDDHDYRDALLRSLHWVGGAERRGEQLHYPSAGRVGNAVLLYALEFGPLWARARGGDPV